MCGIAGIFNYRSELPIEPNILNQMCGSLAHRGPDDSGIFINEVGNLGLAHRRLSIIDLLTGKQPLSNASKSIWIVFNGEIYNFPELKEELLTKGYKFHTTSDTEVIIYLYEEYGESSFERLNGIFAFAIYDSRKQSLILARDHFGVKPLYYAIDSDRLLFGSEIKAILKDTSLKKELDYEALNSFFTFRYNPAPQTLFKNIRKLYPGYYLKINFGKTPELKSYGDYAPTTNNDISEMEAITKYQELLEAAVQRQMISDVPVGLLLSGGIDSAVIGYLMQSFSKDKIKTFTIGFPGKGDFNELDDARITAKLIGSEHYENTINREKYLETFLRSFFFNEEPIAEATIPALYNVAKLASQYLKVVLAGQGADEPLAGYYRYIGEKYITKYSWALRTLPSNILKLLPRNERFKRALYASQFTDEAQRFLAIYTIFTPAQKERLFNAETKKRLINTDEQLVELLYSKTHRLDDALSKILFIDTRMSLSDNLLLFGDKMTMANSLEMRVPFLDVELIKFIESLPSDFKLRGKTRKYIHKKAVSKWLPNDIINRKKRGFSTPMDDWLQNDLADVSKKIFNDEGSACRNFFNINYINDMIDLHKARKENYQKHLFALLSFELWHRTFFQDLELEESMFN